MWRRVARTVDATQPSPRVPMADPQGAIVSGSEAKGKSDSEVIGPDLARRRKGAAKTLPGASNATSPNGRSNGSAGYQSMGNQFPDRAPTRLAGPPGSPDTAQAHEFANALSLLEGWWNGGGNSGGTDKGESLGGGRERPGRPKPPAPPGALDRPTVRKLGRKRLPVEGRVDLHGLTEAQAHERLLGYLQNARGRGLRHVIVITGKGSGGSSGGNDPFGGQRRGVLRRAVPRWFRTEPFRSLVSGHSVAARHDGGEGALYVKLRK